MPRCQRYSESTAAATVTKMTQRAWRPNCTTPYTAVGIMAMQTSSMISRVETRSLTCGEAETFNKFIAYFASFPLAAFSAAAF